MLCGIIFEMLQKIVAETSHICIVANETLKICCNDITKQHPSNESICVVAYMLCVIIFETLQKIVAETSHLCIVGNQTLKLRCSDIIFCYVANVTLRPIFHVMTTLCARGVPAQNSKSG